MSVSDILDIPEKVLTQPITINARDRTFNKYPCEGVVNKSTGFNQLHWRINVPSQNSVLKHLEVCLPLRFRFLNSLDQSCSPDAFCARPDHPSSIFRSVSVNMCGQTFQTFPADRLHYRWSEKPVTYERRDDGSLLPCLPSDDVKMKIPNAGFQERAQKWASKKVVGGTVNGNVDIYYDCVLCIPLDCTPLSAFWLGQKQNSNLSIPFAYTMQIVATFDQQYGPNDAKAPKGQAWTKKLWQIQQPITKLPLDRAGITIPAKSEWEYECARIMTPVEHPILAGARNPASQWFVAENYLDHVRSGGVWPYNNGDWTEGVRCYPFGYHCQGAVSDWNANAEHWLNLDGFVGSAGAMDYRDAQQNNPAFDHYNYPPQRDIDYRDYHPRLVDHFYDAFNANHNGNPYTYIRLTLEEASQLKNIMRSCWPDRSTGRGDQFGKFPQYQDGDLEPGLLWACMVNSTWDGVHTPHHPNAGATCAAIFPNPSGGALLKFAPITMIGVNDGNLGGYSYFAVAGTFNLPQDRVPNFQWHFFTAPVFSLPQNVSWDLIEIGHYPPDKSVTKDVTWERKMFSNSAKQPLAFSELLINQLQNTSDAYSRAVRHLDISKWRLDPTPPTWTPQNDAAGHQLNEQKLSTPVKDSEIMHCLAFGRFKIVLTNTGGPISVQPGYLPDMERMMLFRTKERPCDKVVLVCEKPQLKAKTCALVRTYGGGAYQYSRNGVFPDAGQGVAGRSADYEDQKDEDVNLNGIYTFPEEKVSEHGQILRLDDCSTTIPVRRRVIPWSCGEIDQSDAQVKNCGGEVIMMPFREQHPIVACSAEFRDTEPPYINAELVYNDHMKSSYMLEDSRYKIVKYEYETLTVADFVNTTKQIYFNEIQSDEAWSSLRLFAHIHPDDLDFELETSGLADLMVLELGALRCRCNEKVVFDFLTGADDHFLYRSFLKTCPGANYTFDQWKRSKNIVAMRPEDMLYPTLQESRFQISNLNIEIQAKLTVAWKTILERFGTVQSDLADSLLAKLLSLRVQVRLVLEYSNYAMQISNDGQCSRILNRLPSIGPSGFEFNKNVQVPNAQIVQRLRQKGFHPFYTKPF